MAGDYRLYQGDCLDVLPTLIGVDVVVTDPPYGIGENQARVLSRTNAAAVIDYGAFTWDADRISEAAIKEILRVSRSQVIFGGNHFADMLPASSGWIVWDKQNSGDFSDCELAWTSHKRGVRIVRYMWNGMIKAKPEKRYHPSQKPLDVMRWVIANYTNPGDTVLDPYMGSGTTGVACIMEGRRFIGIDTEAKHVKVADWRIANAQPPLFVMDAPMPEQVQAVLI
jgi:DNA modification methylase